MSNKSLRDLYCKWCVILMLHWGVDDYCNIKYEYTIYLVTMSHLTLRIDVKPDSKDSCWHHGQFNDIIQRETYNIR